MKTAIALATYYLAIGMIIIFAGVIVFKLMFWPPCTTTGRECVVDGWSVAGLAGTVLAVSSTILALFGAIAVAAWWTGLEKRVSEQVDTNLKAQTKNINSQVNTILSHQKAEVQKSFDILNNDFARFTVSFITSFPPWIVDEWAVTALDATKTVDIAKFMVFKYLEYIDRLITSDSLERSESSAYLTQLHAPSLEPMYYWNAALRWQKVVWQYEHQEPDLVKQVNEKINSYKTSIGTWRQ